MSNGAVGCYFDRGMSGICAVFERTTSSWIRYIYDPVDERTSATMIRGGRFEPEHGAFLWPWLCKVPSNDFVLNTDKHTGQVPLPLKDLWLELPGISWIYTEELWWIESRRVSDGVMWTNVDWAVGDGFAQLYVTGLTFGVFLSAPGVFIAACVVLFSLFQIKL